MIANVAKRLIKRFGTKGDAVLNRISGTYDEDTLENVNTSSDIPLLAYIGKVPLDQVTNSTKWFSSIKAMIAIDKDFDGVISQEDTITLNSIKYDIESIIPISVHGKLSYIEAICRA